MNLLDDVMVLRYLRDDLGYRSDLRYQGPFGGGYPPPTTFRGDWMSTRWNRPATATAASGSAPAAAPPGGGGQGGRGAAGRDTTPQQPLRNAMRANPALRVLVGCGIYDLVCSYYANVVEPRTISTRHRRKVAARSYPGGHAMYTDPRAHVQLRRDVVGVHSRRGRRDRCTR